MVEVEEVFDLAIYRPIAFVFVKLVYRLPITPNQVTFLSLVAGLISAWCFSIADGTAFVAAAIWYFAANVFDCGDGMLARLQNSGSPLGRLVDGVVDWIISLAVFFALGYTLSAIWGTSSMWWLVAAAGISSALHAMAFDYYQQEYLSNVRGRKNFLSQEVERIRERLEGLRTTRTSWHTRVFLTIYLSYMAFQERSQFKESQERQAPPEIFRAHNKTIMRWWTFLGSTTNRTALIVFGLFSRPDLFCWLVTIPGNLFLIFMLIWQRNVQRRLDNAITVEQEARSATTA